jgi:hypothetical protein
MNLFTGDKPRQVAYPAPGTVPRTSHKYNRASPRPENISPGISANQSRMGHTQHIFPRPIKNTQTNPFMYRIAEDPHILKVSPVKVRGDSIDENMHTDVDIEIMMPMEEQDQFLSEEQLSAIMKIGLKSLHKFEKKDKA